MAWRDHENKYIGREGRQYLLEMLSKNKFKKSQECKANTQCFILVKRTKLRCLYIETWQFEEKTTLWQGKKVLFAHIEWMSLSLFWFSFEIDV